MPTAMAIPTRDNPDISPVTADSCEYVLGNANVLRQPLVPFDLLVCDFIETFGRELAKVTEFKDYPDLGALAFFARRKQIDSLRAKYESDPVRMGRGLAFHVTPANVPTCFAYSYFFGLLAGNANLVRLPSEKFPQAEVIIGVLRELLQDSRFTAIADRTAMVRYPRGSEWTHQFSEISAARILWGSDETVQSLRALPTSPRTVDLTFPERYSLVIFSPEAVAKASEPELKQLARRFYNDTFAMDQNACSSPSLVVWYGKSEPAVEERFWKELSELVGRDYELQPVQAVDKLTLLCRDVISERAQAMRQMGGITLVTLPTLGAKTHALKASSGYFYEYRTENLKELAPLLGPKYQTLTYYGVPASDLQNFIVSNHITGVDRIVPTGMALEMGAIWDGHDLIRSLSRIVEVR